MPRLPVPIKAPLEPPRTVRRAGLPGEGDPEWRRNYSTLAELSDQVTALLEDQAERGQMLKLYQCKPQGLSKLLYAREGRTNTLV